MRRRTATRHPRKHARVPVDGGDLFYTVTGSGAPLLTIAGGGGDGDGFLPLADRLASAFTVISYDRRANARSTAGAPARFSLAQQADDAHAVMRAAGVDSAFVLGCSSGAVIAMELVATRPESVRTAVAFEPPLARLAVDADRWRRFFEKCARVSREKGPSAAAGTFGMGVMGRPGIAPLMADLRLKLYLRGEPRRDGDERIPSAVADEVFIDHELSAVTDHLPDRDALRRVATTVVFAAGDRTVRRRIWLAEPARRLAEDVGARFVELPGSHVSYMDRPGDWAAALRPIFGD